MHFLRKERLQSLIEQLIETGYHCIGPQVRDGAILFDTLTHADQLPAGIIDEQSPGSYKLKKQNKHRYFDWTTGPQAIKPLVFSPSETLWTASNNNDGTISFNESKPEPQKLAILGVRSCDIAALYLQDKHFLHDSRKDAWYLARRQHMLLITINCTRSSPTCFCVSTDDGPRAHYGYDIALTELDDGFVANSLTQSGSELLQQLDTKPATEQQLQIADAAIDNACKQQRHLPASDLKQLLFDNLQHPCWDEIATRCLSCGNCTAVCPTCFCHSENEIPALDGGHSTHVRQWDSCFTAEHSYIHGITIRAQTSQRYRQWLTHKLGSWHDQFGRSGCVGCGRCISWCPVGIDLTQEVNKLAGVNSQ